MSRENLSSLLLALSLLLLVLGAVTLIPYNSPVVSDLGYHTLCPFAPWSTLTLLFLAWLSKVIRQYIDTRQA